MTIEYLKKGKHAADRALDDAKVSKIVEDTLQAIAAKGDEALREFSIKFDNYNPTSFKLSSAEIENLIKQVSKRDMEDIKFAQSQIRKFAQAQRDSMLDIEIETMPGVILGHKNIPLQTLFLKEVEEAYSSFICSGLSSPESFAKSSNIDRKSVV